MTALLDAFAVIAYLAGEPAADEVEGLLSGDDGAAISAVNVAEVVDRLTRGAGLSMATALERMLVLRRDGLEVVPVDALDGATAGALRATYYDRTTCPLSLADCTALATALRYEVELATADPPLADVARGMGLTVIALPDSAGNRPAAS